MHLVATIENLSYQPTLCPELPAYTMAQFVSGEAFARSSFCVQHQVNTFAISQWVSPKRTRSYPYARVYNTMAYQNRVTIIPFVKDEGADGDRDFVQWDSVALMSLLGVRVILAYYDKAKRNPRYHNKITRQEFDYAYLKERLDELAAYKSDALHWNLRELRERLPGIAAKAQEAYEAIARKTGVRLHGMDGIVQRVAMLREDVTQFQHSSRAMAQAAQTRESQTSQPKERLVAGKATITLTNFLGGTYYLTVDECVIMRNLVFLIEKKHSRNTLLPSGDDVKDGLLKLCLYRNIAQLTVGGRPLRYIPVLGLTSAKFEGCLSNVSGATQQGNLTGRYQIRWNALMHEAATNNLVVMLCNSEDVESQQNLLQSCARRGKMAR
jgi:hypothetical protein